MFVDTDEYAKRLKSAGVLNPLSESAKIIDLVRGTRGESFAPSRTIEISKEENKRITELIAKRAQHIPLSRLTGLFQFSDIEIEICDGVYAPDLGTETMVDYAAQLLEGKEPKRILDLGTGSGCILLALLFALPQATGLGVDNSEKAIALAQKNAIKNSLQNRAEFCLGEWSDGVNETFDLVISNPPRVATDNIDLLLPELRNHDPRESLDGGSDGMNFFRRSAEDFHRIAKKDAFGLFQVGPMYAQSVEQLFQDHGHHGIQVKLNSLKQPACLFVVNEWKK
jgi:release factor glutamine methyltransferase